MAGSFARTAGPLGLRSCRLSEGTSAFVWGLCLSLLQDARRLLLVRAQTTGSRRYGLRVPHLALYYISLWAVDGNPRTIAVPGSPPIARPVPLAVGPPALVACGFD